MLTALFSLYGATASAQATPSGVNLTTSPLPVALSAKPGQTVSTDLRIKNNDPTPVLLQIKLLKFSANNDQGQPRLADRAAGDDYFDWVTFSQNVFTAQPNVWQTITMTVKVPPTAGLGYYYAVAFQKAQPPGTTDRGASIAGGAAILVLLDVKSPNAKRQLSISSFVSKKRIYEFLPADFTVTLHNDGNIFIPPNGSIYISKGDKTIGVLDVNPGHGNILPDSNRIFTVPYNDGFPVYKVKIANGAVVTDKKGNNQYSLTWDTQNAAKLRFGKYTARLLVVYDDGERDVPVEATLSFWVIPWRLLGILLVILVIVGFGLFSIGRKFWRLIRKVGPKKPKKSKYVAKDAP